MPDVYLTRHGAGLFPDDDAAMEWMTSLPQGVQVKAKVTVPRNGGFHRKFFAMLNVAFTNKDWPMIDTPAGPVKVDAETFRKAVTRKAGHYNWRVTPDGDVIPVAKSIAFDKMDQVEFERVYSDVLDVILNEYLDNWTEDDMERAVEKMLRFA